MACFPAVFKAVQAGICVLRELAIAVCFRYKEKLPSKCFQDYIINERFSDALNSQRWRFLKSGLDDFRNGYPPPSDNIIIRGKSGPVPIILQYKKMNASQMVPYKARELPTKSSVDLSKLSVAQKAKKDYIVQAERCLMQHPLALYPHLEESVSPEVRLPPPAQMCIQSCLLQWNLNWSLTP